MAVDGLDRSAKVTNPTEPSYYPTTSRRSTSARPKDHHSRFQFLGQFRHDHLRSFNIVDRAVAEVWSRRKPHQQPARIENDR